MDGCFLNRGIQLNEKQSFNFFYKISIKEIYLINHNYIFMNTSQRFISQIESDADIRDNFTEEQITILKEKAEKNKPPIWDKKIFMGVVYIVGGALLLSIIFAAFSVFPYEYNEIIDPTTKSTTKELIEKDVNNFFVMIASASIGALAGLLVPKPSE